MAREESIDKQVIAALFRLYERLPPDVTQRIEEILRQHTERANEEKRMEEIKELVKRIDFRWENGFMDEEEYLQKRRQLQLEIEALRPVEHDELLKSADLLKNFRGLWEQCTTPQAQHELVKQVVDGVIVLDKEVIALVLKGDSTLLLVNTTVYPSGERGI